MIEPIKINTVIQNVFKEIDPETQLTDKDLRQIPVNEGYQYQEYEYTADKKSTLVGTNNKIEVRIFDENSYNGPKTEDFIRRLDSIYEAAQKIAKTSNLDDNKKSVITKNLEIFRKEAEEKIIKKATVDRYKVEGKKGPQYYAKKREAALDILQDFVGKSLEAIHVEDSNYDVNEALKTLSEVESEVVAEKGRSTLVHVYKSEGQTRISVSEPLGDHTNPSTMRDKPELSNFVKASSYIVNADGSLTKEFEGYRHSSYPPIKTFFNAEGKKLENTELKMARRDGAAQSVEEMIKRLTEDAVEKDPFVLTKQPVEIKLSTMMLLTPLNKDRLFMKHESEMDQLKDSLIALNIYHDQELTLMINGHPVRVEPQLTQMNIPSNDVMKLQTQFTGAKFNNRLNRKGFVEFTKNYIDYINKNFDQLDEDTQKLVKPLVDMYHTHSKLDNLNAHLELAKKSLPALYKSLGELQKDPQNKDLYKAKLKEIRTVEKELNQGYKKMIAVQKEIWKTHRESIRTTQHALEKNYKNHVSQNALEVTQLFLDASDIFYNNKHKKIKHGQQFQARYLLANQKMGNNVEFFCKSGEDRTGRTNNHVEEFLAFRDKHGFFPRFNHYEDLKELEKISIDVHKGSVSKKITDQNAPGAEGLQQGSSFGSNEAPQLGEFDKPNSQLAKQVFANELPQKIRRSTNRIRQMRQFVSHDDLDPQKMLFESEYLPVDQSDLKTESLIGLETRTETETESVSSSETESESESELENEFQKILKEETKVLHDKIDNQNIQIKHLKEDNHKLLEIEAKVNKLIEELDNIINKSEPVSDTSLITLKIKELIDIYHETQKLKINNSDMHLAQEYDRLESKIKNHLESHKHTEHLQPHTYPSSHSTEKDLLSFSITESYPANKNLLYADKYFIQKINAVVSKDTTGSFSLKPINDHLAVIEKDEETLCAVTPKEIEAYSSKNTQQDYEIILETAAKIYTMPLMIYVSASEKPKIEQAIHKLGWNPKNVEFAATHKEYETKQKAAQTCHEQAKQETANNTHETDLLHHQHFIEGH